MGIEDTFLPMAWECTETRPVWLMPFDLNGSVSSQFAFGGMNFGCHTFGGDTFGTVWDGVCLSQVPTKPDLVDALTWERGHCGGCTGTDAAPAERLLAFDVDRSFASGNGGSDCPSKRDVAAVDISSSSY